MVRGGGRLGGSGVLRELHGGTEARAWGFGPYMVSGVIILGEPWSMVIVT